MMFAKLILLLSLESKVRRAEETGKPIKAKEGGKVVYYDFQTAQKINEDYRAMTKRLAAARTQSEERPTTVKLLDAAVSNVRHMVRNAVDNTAGYPIAKWQNKQTAKYLKHHPNTDKYVVDLIPGLFQNIGSQHRYARVLQGRGHLPNHIHPNNGRPEPERVARMVGQYDSLEKRTGAKPHRIISGHSDGAALAIKMVQGYEGRERVMRYKIQCVQARAPSVH